MCVPTSTMNTITNRMMVAEKRKEIMLLGVGAVAVAVVRAGNDGVQDSFNLNMMMRINMRRKKRTANCHEEGIMRGSITTETGMVLVVRLSVPIGKTNEVVVTNRF